MSQKLNTDAFYTLIGAIEATVNFIGAMKKNAQGRYVLENRSGMATLSDETTPSSTSEPNRKVSYELIILKKIKKTLLKAHAKLHGILHSGPTAAEESRAWADFDAAYNGCATDFGIAVTNLAANAPEWGGMDLRLRDLMVAFKVVGNGGSTGSATNWGSLMSSGASNNPSTSISIP